MRAYTRVALVFFLAMTLAACGGGSGGGSGSESSPTMTPITVAPGGTYVMTTVATVSVPAGTTVTGPNGIVTILNGSSDTLNVQIGSVITVPPSATGPANNTVTTGPSTSGISTNAAQVTEIAGSATVSGAPVDGTGAAAIFWGGGHLAFDASGNLIVSDRGLLRKVTPAGVVTTLTPTYAAGSQAADWEGIAIDKNGNIFGSGSSFISPPPSGATYLAAASIVEANPALTVQNFAPNWETSTSNASIGFGGLAVDGNDNLYFADISNNRIVKFTSAGVMSVFAGSGASSGAAAAASFDNVSDLTIDANGNLYVADAVGIQKITPDGTVSTLATMASLGGQSGPIAIDPSGNIYITGFASSIVRLDAQGNITSFQLPQISSFIASMVADGSGNLYVDTRGAGAQILKISF